MNFCETGLFCETQHDFIFVVSKYNFCIPQTKETGKNKVVENSWFKRGNLLFVRGVRNGDQFRIKTYKNSLYAHSTSLIEKVYDDGIALTKDERTQIE